MTARAVNDANATASPTDAAGSRWRLSRAGIINVYQYENEVLHFAGGRLLLRGVNGSGKSTAMNMLLPFLLTAREGRIDAAGEQSGILKSWMLSGRDDAQPVGYLWVEFERRGEYLVCGCGIKANRQSERVTTWWFITPKRPGLDISLVAGGVALSAEGLRATLDGDEVFSERRRRDYRRAIVQRLFGGASIDQHVGLLNKVRSPRVGDRIDLDLRDHLVDALPHLSEQALTEAAQPLDDLEEHRRSVADLARTRDAVLGLLEVYRSYCGSDLRRRCEEGRTRLAARRDRARDEHKRTQAAQAAEAAVQRLEAGIAELEANERRLRREIDALEKSPAYREGQQLESLRQLVADLARQLDKAEERVASGLRRAEDEALGLRRTQQRCLGDLDDLNDSLAAATEMGGRCGLDRRPPGPAALEQSALEGIDATEPGPLDPEPLDRQIAAVHAAALRRGADADGVEEALDSVRAAEQGLHQAESALNLAVDAAEGASERLTESSRHLSSARAEWERRARLWAAQTHPLLRGAGVGAPATEAQAGIEADNAAPTDPDTLRERLLAEADSLVEHWRSAVGAVELRLHGEREAEQAAQTLLDDLAARREPDPPRLQWQHDADHCLADLVDFAPGLDETQRAGLEAALQASGLLSARPADGVLELAGGELVAVVAGRVPSPLSDCLTVTVPQRLLGAVDQGSVAKLLDSISCDPSSDASTAVTLDGAFRVGSLRGRHTKERAEHIGAAARLAALERSRAEAALRLNEARGAMERSLEECSRHGVSLQEARDQRSRLPSTDNLVAARAAVDAATAAVDEAVGRRGAASARVAEAERVHGVAFDALHRTATTLSLPHDREGLGAFRRELGEAASALRGCESRLMAVSRSLEAWRGAADRWRRAATDCEQEHAELARLKSRHAEEHATLVTIEDSIGAEYADVIDTRDRCRSELDGTEAKLPSTREEWKLAVNRQGEADAGARAAQDKRRQAEQACETARLALEDAVSTPGYLAALDAGLVAARSAGSEGLRKLLDALEAVLPAEQATVVRSPASRTVSGDGATQPVEVRADNVRQSLLQRRDALGAGWDAETSQPDPIRPLAVVVTGPSGRAPLAEQVQAVQQQHQQVAGLLNRKQDDALRELLQGLIAQEIAEKIHGARRLVELMNERLGGVRTAHWVGVRLRWRRSGELDPATLRMVDLLAKEPDLRTDDDNSELRQALSDRLDEARTEHPDLPYRQLIADTLDYKQWHEMAVMVRRGGSEARLGRTTPLSEGEKKLVTYLPLFAAVAASYDALGEQHATPGAERPGIARFVLLDDAFAKVSEDSHAALFGLLVDLDLDLIATSERLWGTHSTVPELAVTEVIRDAALRTILLEHYRWDGATLELQGT